LQVVDLGDAGYFGFVEFFCLGGLDLVGRKNWHDAYDEKKKKGEEAVGRKGQTYVS